MTDEPDLPLYDTSMAAAFIAEHIDVNRSVIEEYLSLDHEYQWVAGLE